MAPVPPQRPRRADAPRRPARGRARRGAEGIRHERDGGRRRDRNRVGDQDVPQHHDQGHRGAGRRMHVRGTALRRRAGRPRVARQDLSAHGLDRRAARLPGEPRGRARATPRGGNARGRADARGGRHPRRSWRAATAERQEALVQQMAEAGVAVPRRRQVFLAQRSPTRSPRPTASAGSTCGACDAASDRRPAG